LLTGTPLNVSSFMGIILMVGLVVKNGIILFEYFERLEGKLSFTEAMVEAGRICLRPLLMTTLCTLFGLLPLALALGAGAELQKPFAIAVIGGLTVSMVVTLVMMPVLYVSVRRRSQSILSSDANCISLLPTTSNALYFQNPERGTKYESRTSKQAGRRFRNRRASGARTGTRAGTDQGRSVRDLS